MRRNDPPTPLLPECESVTLEAKGVLVDSVVPVDTEFPTQLWSELWVSLASLLRSYAAAHGLHANRTAEIKWDEARILARQGENWINLRREGAQVTWMRENGEGGVLELTEAGRLRVMETNSAAEEEMDMAAENWARELMR